MDTFAGKHILKSLLSSDPSFRTCLSTGKGKDKTILKYPVITRTVFFLSVFD